jgi:hypothetical protein
MNYVRKLTKISSHSFAIIVPKAFVKKFGWREKQKLSITEGARKTLTIKDWRRK